jgi:cell division protein FtsL
MEVILKHALKITRVLFEILTCALLTCYATFHTSHHCRAFLTNDRMRVLDFTRPT